VDPIRDRLSRIARAAIEDPSRAPDLARQALAEIDSASREAAIAPSGYTYAGAHTLVALVRDLAVEPLPTTAEDRTGVPIWTTANQPQQIKVPFDCWIYGVASWGVLAIAEDFFFLTPNCAEGRDLVAVDWGLDGFESFTTDGYRRMLVPSSAVCGTRNHPRALSWKVQRNQLINVRFRNLINAHVPQPPPPAQPIAYPNLAIGAVAFYAVNMEMP